MAGKAKAVTTGTALRDAVAAVAVGCGLEAKTEVSVGRRIWGAKRSIDVVVTHPETRARLGLECKFQGSGGSAEEKIPLTIDDIQSWPIPGLVVFSGEGFSRNMRAYLHSTGKAVELPDLEVWLRMFFGLELD